MVDRETKRPTTIKDVAREAGVSISSVSCALNGKSGVRESPFMTELIHQLELAARTNGL